jgi:hypothetical protein
MKRTTEKDFAVTVEDSKLVVIVSINGKSAVAIFPSGVISASDNSSTNRLLGTLDMDGDPITVTLPLADPEALASEIERSAGVNSLPFAELIRSAAVRENTELVRLRKLLKAAKGLRRIYEGRGWVAEVLETLDAITECETAEGGAA